MLSVSLICGLFLLGGSPVTAAQGADSKTFDNGHTVSGPFYAFYTSVGTEEDSERVFGLPITVVFDDPLPSGKRIQYFERARMELDPVTNQVSLGKLGEFAYDPSQPGIGAPIQANDPQCRPFPNGKQVCYAFRQFYEKYGEKYFGQPVTNAMFTLEGRLVQYFEDVRMEWNGYLPEGKRIVVSALGQFDFDKRVGNQTYRRPEAVEVIGAPVIPNLHAFAGKPLVANGDRQQIFALLYDQFGKPIKGVSVTFSFINEEANSTLPAVSGTTNDDGIAITEFDVSKIKPNNVVQVKVSAQVGGETKEATTWYRVWW